MPAAMSPSDRQTLLDANGIADVLRAMVRSILEYASDDPGLVLVGIRRRGVELAERLAKLIAEQSGRAVATGAIDITLYRDDLQLVGPRPIIGSTDLPFELEGRVVIIVDDVLFTGRTVRAAMNELADYGRPSRVGLAVLIDRGGRELPIQGDVVGRRVDVSPGQRVDVSVQELDGRDAVELVTASGEDEGA